MKNTGWIFVDVVITSPCPVTITIDQCHVDGKKPKRAINIQHAVQFFFQLFRGCLI